MKKGGKTQPGDCLRYLRAYVPSGKGTQIIYFVNLFEWRTSAFSLFRVRYDFFTVIFLSVLSRV